MTALVAVAHGSRDPRSAAVVHQLLDVVRALAPSLDVRGSFLDLSVPLLGDVLRGVHADGHRSAVVVPLLLGKAFHARVDAALRPLAREDLTSWSADALVGLYRRLEDDLLRNWQTPLVNDFFAMIFYGLARKLTAKWCGDTDGMLQNDLLCGEGGMISAEPAKIVDASRRP